jgi:hypothetical protein
MVDISQRICSYNVKGASPFATYIGAECLHFVHYSSFPPPLCTLLSPRLQAAIYRTSVIERGVNCESQTSDMRNSSSYN